MVNGSHRHLENIKRSYFATSVMNNSCSTGSQSHKTPVISEDINNSLMSKVVGKKSRNLSKYYCFPIVINIFLLFANRAIKADSHMLSFISLIMIVFREPEYLTENKSCLKAV